MKRFGQVIQLRPEAVDEYKRLHAAIWPEIASAITAAGIQNYSIYLRNGVLFAYFEYAGPDDQFEAAMAQMAGAPRMREWWDITERMQLPFEDRAPGEWWSAMKEVFYLA